MVLKVFNFYFFFLPGFSWEIRLRTPTSSFYSSFLHIWNFFFTPCRFCWRRGSTETIHYFFSQNFSTFVENFPAIAENWSHYRCSGQRLLPFQNISPEYRRYIETVKCKRRRRRRICLCFDSRKTFWRAPGFASQKKSVFPLIFLNSKVKMSIGVPIKVLHEAEGHIVTCETITGEVYRGKLIEAEDNMNCQMTQITVTYRDGRTANLENVYIRGSKIRFLILPDMLKNAPMFKKQGAKSGTAGRGKSAILRAQGEVIYSFLFPNNSLKYLFFPCSGSGERERGKCWSGSCWRTGWRLARGSYWWQRKRRPLNLSSGYSTDTTISISPQFCKLSISILWIIRFYTKILSFILLIKKNVAIK